MDKDARRRAIVLGMIRQRFQLPQERIMEFDERLMALAVSAKGATTHHRLVQIFQWRTLREHEDPEDALRFVEFAVEVEDDIIAPIAQVPPG